MVVLRIQALRVGWGVARPEAEPVVEGEEPGGSLFGGRASVPSRVCPLSPHDPEALALPGLHDNVPGGYNLPVKDQALSMLGPQLVSSVTELHGWIHLLSSCALYL